MHPFEHRKDTPILQGSRNDWITSMHDLYLDVVTGNTVLEIASNNGDISREVLKHSPKNLTMLDPDPTSARIKNIEFINEDVNFWLPKSPKFDVVICFGLFYHLHSSLHLLEMIVNHCQPRYLVLDCVVAPHPLCFDHEKINQSGSRWINNGWRHAPFNLNIPFHVFNQSLDHMGYKLTKTHRLCYDFFPKSNHWVGQWRII